MTPPADGVRHPRLPLVGIAGGHGGLGSLFARLLAESGVPVRVSDRDTALSNDELAASCDLCFVAVPLSVTPEVLAAMAVQCRQRTTLVSLGSLMEPAAEVLAHGAGERLLLHPLFGPGRKSLRGATLALASPHSHPAHPGSPPVGSPGDRARSARGDEATSDAEGDEATSDAEGDEAVGGGPWRAWLLTWLHEHGATVVTTTPEQHDRAMAAAQALLHGSYAALAPSIARALPGADPLAWASPTLRVQLALMARILHQDARLYGEMLALNRHAPAALDGAIERMGALRAALDGGPESVAAYFEAAREALGAAGPALAREGDRALDEGDA